MTLWMQLALLAPLVAPQEGEKSATLKVFLLGRHHFGPERGTSGE